MAPSSASAELRGSIRPDATTRRSLAIASGVTGAAIALTQAYSLLVGHLSVDESYAGYVLVPLALFALFLFATRLEGRPLREFGLTLRSPLGVTLAFAALLSMLYLAVRLDPGFIFGFGRIPAASPALFGLFLLSSPVIALAEVSFFFGYLFRTLSRAVSLRTAIFLASAAFALYATDLTILPGASVAAAGQYVLTTTVEQFVLGIVLALYFYKSQWSLLGPVAFASSILAVDLLLPVGVAFPSWAVGFVSVLVALTVLLLVVGVGLAEPRLQSLRYLGEPIGPRRLRFRYRARDRAETRNVLLTGAVVGVVAISFSYGLPSVLGASQPILAIASGSMVPTFERGTLVVIEHVDPSAIKVGTIIAFSVSCLPSPTVHRVIKIVSESPHWVYQTKGDANPSQDPCTVPYSQVLGAVVLNVPYVGYLILDPLFAGALIVLLVLVPVVWRGQRT